MRTFVLVLAILLLPLRGWLGDAMAVESMQPQHEMHATHEMHGTGATADIAGMDIVEATATTSSDAHHDCQSTCTDCQLCHSIAIAVWPQVPSLAEAPRETPTPLSVAFVSAEPAPDFKPPIF